MTEAETLKVTVLGDSFVGKSSLIFAYTQPDRFQDDWEATVFNTYSTSVHLNRRPYQLHIFDTSGRSTEKLTSLRLLSYPHVNVILLCFSMIDPLSLDSCRRRWLPEIRAAAPPNTPIILVGTKEDLIASSPPDKQIDRKFAQKMCDEMGCSKLLTCSALTHRGLKRVFDEALLAASGQPADVKPTATQWNGLCCTLL